MKLYKAKVTMQLDVYFLSDNKEYLNFHAGNAICDELRANLSLHVNRHCGCSLMEVKSPEEVDSTWKHNLPWNPTDQEHPDKTCLEMSISLNKLSTDI